MILIKIMIFGISALLMIAGIFTMVSPDVNSIFLPIVVEGIQESHFARSYAGFVTAVGYLVMRFLYSSSKVQVGTVVLYIIIVMMILRRCKSPNSTIIQPELKNLRFFLRKK